MRSHGGKYFAVFWRRRPKLSPNAFFTFLLMEMKTLFLTETTLTELLLLLLLRLQLSLLTGAVVIIGSNAVAQN